MTTESANPPAPAIPYKNPALWVPTSYFAMGTVYITVSTASNIMLSNLGLPNDKAAAYSSLTGLAFTFKPFWAPLLELFKTKKFFVIIMQLTQARDGTSTLAAPLVFSSAEIATLEALDKSYANHDKLARNLHPPQDAT